ncbi:MAG: 50S ribosomal protein L11 methyltransferase [Nitrospirota bacterium]
MNNRSKMQWYEICVNLPLPLLESTYNFLWLYANGLKVEKQEKTFLLKAYSFSYSPDDLLKRLNNFLCIMTRSLRAYYTPPTATTMASFPTDEFIIVPAPASYIPPFGIPILLQRGRAFGIGSHPCTIYCLQAVKDILRDKSKAIQIKQTMDAGTGTGILVIAAAKLGIHDITGVEIVNEFIKEAEENVKVNKIVNGIKFLSCSVTEIKGQFNLIFANLYGAFLVDIASSLVKQMAPDGWIIIGGMVVPYDEIVIAKFIRYGLKEHTRYCDEEWSVSVLQKV